MTETVQAGPSVPPGAGHRTLGARLAGVLFSPRATYADIAARPRWFGALLVVVIVGAASTFVFLSTEIGQQATFDQQVRTMEAFGMKLNDVALQRMEQGLPRARYFGAASQAVFFPLAGVLVAGIAFGVFNAILGADGTFRQVFAVVCHSGVVISLAQLFSLPLDYARETLSSPTSLAVFLPFLDESSFPARFLGVIDLFQVWWIVSLAIGLGVLYKRRTQPILVSLFSIYLAIALVIAAIKSAA